jgi:hypothetical protein
MGLSCQLLFPVTCPLGKVTCTRWIIGWVTSPPVWTLRRWKRIYCPWLGSNHWYLVVQNICTWHFLFLMFCWPWIIVYQYNVTYFMHCLFNVLRIKGLYTFQALLGSSSGGATQRHLVYCVRMSVGCATIAVSLQSLQSWHSQMTLYACNILSAVCWAPPEDEQIMIETCWGPWFSIHWIESALSWFHYTDFLFVLGNIFTQSSG